MVFLRSHRFVVRTWLFSLSLFMVSTVSSEANEAAPAGESSTPTPSGGDSKVADTPHFDVMEYRIEGNSRLDNRLIEKTIYRFLGPNRSIDDV